MMMNEYIKKLIEGQDLTIQEANAAMDTIMSGEATSAQIGSYLTALRMKGETIEEITGCAKGMRERCIQLVGKGDLMDIVGTGGDCTNTFNVSTNGLYMNYKLTGLANLAVQKHTPVLRIPALSGIVQPSAVVEGVAKASKATSYYLLDIDHNDAPTYVEHGNLTTSFNSYVPVFAISSTTCGATYLLNALSILSLAFLAL